MAVKITNLCHTPNTYPISISGVLVETFYPRLLYEIGWLGIFAFLAMVSVITWTTLRAYRSLQQLNLRGLGICLWLFILLISYNTFYYPLVVEPVNIYYWFFAGVLLKLPLIDNHFTNSD